MYASCTSYFISRGDKSVTKETQNIPINPIPELQQELFILFFSILYQPLHNLDSDMEVKPFYIHYTTPTM